MELTLIGGHFHGRRNVHVDNDMRWVVVPVMPTFPISNMYKSPSSEGYRTIEPDRVLSVEHYRVLCPEGRPPIGLHDSIEPTPQAILDYLINRL